MTSLDLGRIGVWGHLDSLTVGEVRNYARRVEALGYGALWVPETVGREPFTLLGLLAGETSRLALGTSIVSIWGRDAQATRMSAETLAEATSGRFVLGLGVSHPHLAAKLRGHVFDRPLTRMREYLAAYRAAVYKGPRDDGLEPPILVAALRERMTDLAATDADGAFPYLVTPERVAWMRARLDAAAADGGRPILAVTLPVALDGHERRAGVPEALPAHADLPRLVGAPGLHGRRLGGSWQRSARRGDGRHRFGRRCPRADRGAARGRRGSRGGHPRRARRRDRAPCDPGGAGVTQPAAVARAMATAARIPADDLPRLRRRMSWVLFTVAALGSTGYIAAVTVGTLVAAEMSGGAALGGLPTTTTTIGTAVAASLIAMIMLRRGRRIGLLLGLAVGVFGGAIVFISILAGSIPLLLLGSAFTGFANAAGNLGRYIAADMATPERRASALGLVVWGTTIGAVIGPNLTAPAGEMAVALGFPELAGPYLLTVFFIGLAWIVSVFLLRPEPYALADPSALPGPVDPLVESAGAARDRRASLGGRRARDARRRPGRDGPDHDDDPDPPHGPRAWPRDRRPGPLGAHLRDVRALADHRKADRSVRQPTGHRRRVHRPGRRCAHRGPGSRRRRHRADVRPLPPRLRLEPLLRGRVVDAELWPGAWPSGRGSRASPTRSPGAPRPSPASRPG